MLKVIFFSVFFGIGLLLVDNTSAKPVKDFINGLNEVIMKMVDLIMLFAPFAVFALICPLIVETPDSNLFIALMWYMITVIIGLLIVLILYGVFIALFAKRNPIWFYKGCTGSIAGLFHQFKRRNASCNHGKAGRTFGRG